MKYIAVFITLLLKLNIGWSQMIKLTTDKTSSLVFPFSITHVDRGTRDILVQPLKEAENILLVKASIKDFPPTNLSVVTSDGCIYTFQVIFADAPTLFTYHIQPQQSPGVSTYANVVLDNLQSVRGIKDHKWDVQARVIGIYIKDNFIYYQVQVENDSPIDYDNEFIRFYIRDKRKGKRTAVQENELKPVHTCGNMSKVKAGTKGTMVFVFAKFTLPDGKYLAIEINEKNGGRHLLMKVGNNKITRAIALPDLGK